MAVQVVLVRLLCTSQALKLENSRYGVLGMRCRGVHRLVAHSGGDRTSQVLMQDRQTGGGSDLMRSAGRGELLSTGEKISRGMASSWVNPAYWKRQYVTASHITKNVPPASRVLELGKDAKNLYYISKPKAVTLIVPPSNQKAQEGPIREAAAKLNVPFILHTDRPLDTIPIPSKTFDAALCMEMLDGAPESAASGAIALLANALKVGGVLLFVERQSVGMPHLAQEFGLTVQSEMEGGYDVGMATRRVVGKSRKSAPKKKKSQQAPVPVKAGFGSIAAKKEKKREK
ncbi:hypothetical protein AB1Y20_008389 [Prymnesium parvum]|uniref:Ribosomal RNA-processing protein 8 n=1 Tax=Prymnesium parvum TaxID=97485 RepID=A0AB34IR33_PRYPA|mmetsp:Transcript_3534/g.8553  ORF Transcript_3534/g.8553 Transcript_3534/m.8553 type:complete len:287 (-) Transcript_3534:170-1030(-)